MRRLESPSPPAARGTLSEHLLTALGQPPHRLGEGPAVTGDPLGGEDLHLALYCCYELHYRGFAGVDERWEWEPSLLAFRARLEAAFEAGLVAAVPRPAPPRSPEAMDLALRALIDADDAPGLSRFLEHAADHDQLLEWLVQRSANLLKEADPYTLAVPRLTGPAKAAMVEILADEYGGGRPERVHSRLFAEEMEAVGLDAGYDAYLDHVPAAMLATVNLVSFFGLHRRWRAAAAGHLAVTEMTSAIPNRRYANALRRLGHEDATAYHDEHVVADAIHESIAAVDLAGGLARQDERLGVDALWGAACLIELEGRFARRTLGAWEAGASALLTPLGDAAAA